MTTKKPKTVRLDAFIENPDNPQTVTGDAFALLVDSIRAAPSSAPHAAPRATTPTQGSNT